MNLWLITKMSKYDKIIVQILLGTSEILHLMILKIFYCIFNLNFVLKEVITFF